VVDKSLWTRKIEAEPEHSRRFLQRFRDMAAAGQDIAGEARFVDAMAPRGARVFDAGCGSGRTGGPLARLGHSVVGVDVDPVLIDAAKEDYPGATWLVGDLAELELGFLVAAGVTERFDIAVAAGNVMPFLAPSTRREVLSRLRAVLAPGGRAAVGFGAGRGYPFDEFFEDVAATGWEAQATFRGWNLLPFDAESEFLVAVMAPGVPGRSGGRSHGGFGASMRDAHTQPTARPRPSAGSDPMGGNTLRPLH
jgi:SAM-dependent methyltransferase